MKITSINVENYLGARKVNLQLSNPVNIFAGANGAGKSSIQEAIRHALVGESTRVSLKKDFPSLITEGAKMGMAEIIADDTNYTVVLPSGKGVHRHDAALPYVLDAQRFASLSDNDRRSFLFGLMGIKLGKDTIKQRMVARGCALNLIDEISLSAGCEVAHKQALEKAKENKVVWRTVTGETYGEKKAATWTAPKPDFDPAKLVGLKQKLSSTDAGIAAANQHIGALQASARQHAESAKRVIELKERAGMYARVKHKLSCDESELKKWEQTVIRTRDLASSGQEIKPYECPECEALLLMDNNDRLIPYAPPEKLVDAEAAIKLPEYEKALRLFQNAVANGQRDLAQADAAAKALAEINAATGAAPSKEEIDAAQKRLSDLKSERSIYAADLEILQSAERQAKKADECTKAALDAHDDVQAWQVIADALAPDGIPGEMLKEALQPINRRLLASAVDTRWAHVTIGADMGIFVDVNAGDDNKIQRPYALLSESEQWRADAMIAEAIGYFSGIRLLVLDRFDVLDSSNRQDLLYWLETLVDDGDVDTALLFGTLKALPKQLPADSIGAYWIEDGVNV